MRCTRYGAELASESRFCTSCGAEAEPVSEQMPEQAGSPSPEPASEPEPTPETEPEPARCPVCGAEAPEGTRFCTACGAMLAPPAAEPAPLSDDPIDNIGMHPFGAVPVAASAPDHTTPLPRIASQQTPSANAPAGAGAPQASATQPAKRSAPAALWVLLGIAIAVLVAGGAYIAISTTAMSRVEEAVRDVADAASQADNADDASDAAAPSTQADESGDASGNAAVNTATDAVAQDGYILPESDRRVYAASELTGMTARDLYIARNEIYARHGRIFQNDDLREHFSKLSWYAPTYAPESFDANVTLSDVELANIDVIVKVEQEMGSPWAVE